jgi:hypothetical protein
MSEEVTEEVVEKTEVEPTQEAPQSNPLFKTLFEIEEGLDSEPENEEKVVEATPMTLNEAVDEIDQPLEQVSEEPEQIEEESKQEEVAKEDLKKSEPKKKKLRKVVDPDIPDDIKPQLQLSDEPEEDDVDDFAETLLPEEREVYDLAKYASSNMDKYKGYDVKFKEFFKKSKDFLDKRVSDDPHYNPSDDEDYATFIQRNRPDFTKSDAKKIERDMWISQAKKEVRKELEPETQKLKKKLEQAEKAPAARQAKGAFRSMAQKIIIPEEYKEEFEKGGTEAIEKFSKENPLEYQIIDNAAKDLLQYGDELTDIFLKTKELDDNNPVHKELISWVNLEQDNFIKTGQTEQDGKLFMRRERYFTLPENKRSEYYTWSDDDLLKILALRTQEKVNSAISHQRQILKNSGYVKNVETKPAQTPKNEVVNEKPPVVNATPRPGNNLSPNTPATKNNALLNVLGF